jgi:hypothetical protein
MNRSSRFDPSVLRASSLDVCRRGRPPVALASLAACAVLAACAAAIDEDGASGPPDFGGPVPGAGGTTSGNPSMTPNGMMPPANNPSPTPTGSAGSEGVPGNTPISNGAGGSSGTGSNNGSGAGAGGATGAAGSAAVDPNGSAGSSMNAGQGGTNAAAGTGGSGNQPPTPPTGPDIDCPAGASFCSGFESGAFPAGTQFHSVGPGLPNPFAFDTTEVFAGTQALVIPATNSGGFFYRALAVPVPGQDFWVRLYMHLSTPLGDNSHDSVFGASSGALTADVNGEALVELSEQFNEILLNTDDALFNPPTNNTLPANTWLCMEAHYNGGSGDVQIFADGAPLIDAAGYRPVSFQTFRIGYMRYNDDRTVRYDDVVVAPNRVGCD